MKEMRKEKLEKFKYYAVGLTLTTNFKLRGVILSCDEETFLFRTDQEDSYMHYDKVEILIIRTFNSDFFKFKGILVERDGDRGRLEAFINLFSREQLKLIYQIDLEDNIFLIQLNPGERARFLTYYKARDVIITEGLGDKKDKYNFELVK